MYCLDVIPSKFELNVIVPAPAVVKELWQLRQVLSLEEPVEPALPFSFNMSKAVPAITLANNDVISNNFFINFNLTFKLITVDPFPLCVFLVHFSNLLGITAND